MVDFYQKITDMQKLPEDVIRFIPGLKQMFEKEDRRQADRLLREHIALQYDELLGEFNKLQRKMMDKGGLSGMEQAQRIDGKLQTFIDRIRSAAEGYSGVFDAVKIDADALERVYAFDHALLSYKDQFSTGLMEMDKAIGTDAITDVLYQLEEVVTEANNTFKRRVEAMQGISQDAV